VDGAVIGAAAGGGVLVIAVGGGGYYMMNKKKRAAGSSVTPEVDGERARVQPPSELPAGAGGQTTPT